MGLTEWVLLAVALLVLLGWLLWAQATRVDRLHRTVLASRTTLETQLLQRATAASSLATSGVLDPASAVVLLDVADRALQYAPEHVVHDGLEGSVAQELVEEHYAGAADPPSGRDRGRTESELSRTLRAVLGGPGVRDALAADPRAAEPLRLLEHAWYRAQLARRFHNAHVAEVRRLRSHALVRVLHLAGHAAMPEPVELDDASPHE